MCTIGLIKCNFYQMDDCYCFSKKLRKRTRDCSYLVEGLRAHALQFCITWLCSKIFWKKMFKNFGKKKVQHFLNIFYVVILHNKHDWLWSKNDSFNLANVILVNRKISTVILLRIASYPLPDTCANVPIHQECED